MSRIYHARYVGPRRELLFCGALTRPDPRSARHVLAQFDCMRVNGVKVRPDYGVNGERIPLCFGWHRFKRSDFKFRPAPSYAMTRKRFREWCERGVHWIDPDAGNCSRCGWVNKGTSMPIRCDQSGWMP